MEGTGLAARTCAGGRLTVGGASWLLVCLSWLGCADGPTDDREPDDSRVPPTWVVDGEPLVVSGSISADGPLYTRVADAIFGVEGAIYVADGGSAEVHVIRADGSFARSIGGRGGGPGEFIRPSELYVMDSLLLVWDPPSRRLSRFDLGGDLVGTRSVATALSPNPRLVGLLPDGVMLFASSRSRAFMLPGLPRGCVS